jgi:uncharacterized membrane protein
MTTMTATDKLIQDYLDRLKKAGRTLPPDQRAEMVAEIRAHISVTLAQSEDQGEATVRTILDRLGTPEDIAAEAGIGLRPTGEATGRRVAAFELVTIVLLLIGGIVLPALGWIIGAVLLWASACWTLRDKLIGTLVVPGGLTLAVWLLLFAGSTTVCSSNGPCETSGITPGTGIPLFLVAVLCPIGSAIYLLRRAGRATA